MTDFYADFHGAGAAGLSADQYFYKQVFDAFQANVQGGTLPFFNKELDKILQAAEPMIRTLFPVSPAESTTRTAGTTTSFLSCLATQGTR
ncbi:MAG: hypothetical protein K2H09_07005 [Treponemataceae bacterium]|nr:hypothetical protein [Treponemataceae bacterium]